MSSVSLRSARRPRLRLRRILARRILNRPILGRPIGRPTTPLLPPAYDDLAEYCDTPLRDIVLVSRYAPVRVANELARRYPGCTVHLLDHGISAERLARLSDAVRRHPAPDAAARQTALADLPAPQLIIDIATNPAYQLARFTGGFYFLAPGGAYVLHHRPRSPGTGQPRAAPHRAPLVALEAAVDGDQRTVLTGELLASAARVDSPDGAGAGTITVVRKRLEHRVSLRDSQADERLAARFGSTWGETLAERPARRFEVAATIVEHGERGAWHGQTEHPVISPVMDVPRLRLRRYRDVVCWPEQLVAKDNVWLPDTYRHAGHQRLQHRRLTSPTHWHARRSDTSPTTPRRIDGPVFYLDTEYPGHFGHVLTEVVSRWWGWGAARRLDPRVRPLLTRPFGSDGMPQFQRDIFSALGIDPDDVEYVDRGEAVSVGELYAASPMLNMPFYASPELAEAWATVGSALRSADDHGRPRRIFVARRVKPIRSCLNTEQVETFFRGLGFELFYPEDHSFRDQVAAFCAADVIAGFAGSNMFTAAFAGPKTLIVLTADSYNANNEFFIAAVTGGELHYVIGDAQHKHPPGHWAWRAYQANFTIDLDRFGPEIRAVVGG